jgi:hypothetical protein
MITVDEINEAWGWVGLNAEEVLGENAFGNLIIRDDDGRYWRLPRRTCAANRWPRTAPPSMRCPTTRNS